MLSFINISIFNTMFSNIVDSLLICYFIDKENLSYARKLLHFNKDPDYHQIPKEPSLKNNYFLQTLIEHSNKKHQKNIPPNNENSMNNISDPPSEVQRQSQEDLKKVTHHPNRKFPKTIIMGLETKKESPSQKQILQNRFVEQYSLPKINDIIRGSSSIDNAWITDEKKLPVPSKHRLEQQGSPYKESPFSDVIWNNNENVFNFQREGFKLNINLKMEENL